MIITTQNEGFVSNFFHSALMDGHRVFSVPGNRIVGPLKSLFERENFPPDEEVYVFGVDAQGPEAELAYEVYKMCPKRKIWSVPRLEEPDTVKYVFKKKFAPEMLHIFNCEQFVAINPEDAILYYETVVADADFSKTSDLVKKYGDYWKMSSSEYEKDRMNQVRLTISKIKDIKKIFDVGCYLGQLDDLLEINGFEVTRSDIAPEIIESRNDILDFSSMTTKDFQSEFERVDCVLIASVLFAYDTKESSLQSFLGALKETPPKYILYEDALVNLRNNGIISNKWVDELSILGYSLETYDILRPVVESFSGKKNIKRLGSFSALFKHWRD